MHRLLLRSAVATSLAIAILAAPAATVHACSCAQLSGAESVEFGDLAFIGTVTNAAPGGQDDMMGAPLVHYAFEVERASQETGPAVEVVSHDDPGGASCGFSFGVGERWFVAAATEGDLLRTNLCSGNRLADELDDAEMTALVKLLPIEPVPGEEPGGAAGFSIPVPLLAAIVGVGLLAAASALAFRRDRPS